MKSLRYFLGILIFFTCIQQVKAQSNLIDSLENKLKKSDNDSVRVYLIIELADKYFSSDSLKSFRYLADGYRITKKLNWDYVYGYYYDHKAIIQQMAGNSSRAKLLFDTAIYYYQKSVDAKHNPKEVADAKLSIATCKGQLGEILAGMGNDKEAILVYITAMEAWKASDDINKNVAIGVYYSKISTLYYNLNQFDKSLEYDKLALSLIGEGNDVNTAWALIYICDDFNGLKLLDSSLRYLALAKPLVEKLNDRGLNIQYYNKLSSICRQRKDYKGAIEYANKTLAISVPTNNDVQTVAAQKIIGLCYEKMEEYAAARKYLLMALPVAVKKNFMKEQTEILEILVRVEKKTNNKAQAFVYLEQLTAVKDSFNTAATKKSLAEIENKYQAAEKEKTIIQLQAEKDIQALSIRQKSILNYVLVGFVAILAMTAFLAFRNIRHRQLLSKKEAELQLQHIRELEKDKQLVVVDSMLRGQEEERSRLAKDLHDWLGGLLSGVKFSLINMKDNLIITPDNMAVFERSLDMLDTSIRELRRVAYNMMPEMLVKFGLDEALKEYCNTVNATKLITVKYQSFGMDNRPDSSTEIIIYRIMQELLNNILKHALATDVLIQLVKENNRLNIVVEDNGKGFDPAILKESKGAGWTSIQSRVDYLKGRLDINSGPGKGTLINIEFNL